MVNTNITLPKNFYTTSPNRFYTTFQERHENEQFFWNKRTVDKLTKACRDYFIEQTCCLTTPSLAHNFNETGRPEVLLDIDERFQYLPKFRWYDVRHPKYFENDFRFIILDPPFFTTEIEKFRDAVDLLTNHNYNTKILIGFLRREEKRLISAFQNYNLRETSFPLEYESIKPNKWRNFALYANIDLPGIKRKPNSNSNQSKQSKQSKQLKTLKH